MDLSEQEIYPIYVRDFDQQIKVICSTQNKVHMINIIRRDTQSVSLRRYATILALHSDTSERRETLLVTAVEPLEKCNGKRSVRRNSVFTVSGEGAHSSPNEAPELIQTDQDSSEPIQTSHVPPNNLELNTNNVDPQIDELVGSESELVIDEKRDNVQQQQSEIAPLSVTVENAPIARRVSKRKHAHKALQRMRLTQEENKEIDQDLGLAPAPSPVPSSLIEESNDYIHIDDLKHTYNYPTQQLQNIMDQDFEHVINTDNLRSVLLEDPITAAIIKSINDNDSTLIATLPHWIRHDLQKGYYIINNTVLYHTEKSAYFIPPAIQHEVLTYFHESNYLMHQGKHRMTALMKNRVYWPGINKDIASFCRNCKACNVGKANPNIREGYMQLFEPERPLQMVHIDIVGPLPITTTGNRYILTMMDRYTRMIKMIPMAECTATTVAIAFKNHWLFNYGIPDSTITDRGTQFTSALFKILGKVLGFQRLFTTAYHPQTNGRLERFHRYLKERLRIIAQSQDLDYFENDDWDVFIPNIQFSYNITPHTATNIAPYNMLYGQWIKIPFDQIINSSVSDEVDEYLRTVKNPIQVLSTNKRVLSAKQKYDMDTLHIQHNSLQNEIKAQQQRVGADDKDESVLSDIDNYVASLKSHQESLLHDTNTKINKYNAAQKRYYDKNRVQAIEYKAGEKVYIDTSVGKVGNPRKLGINRKQAIIVDQIGSNVYAVKYKDGKVDPINVERIYKVTNKPKSKSTRKSHKNYLQRSAKRLKHQQHRNRIRKERRLQKKKRKQKEKARLKSKSGPKKA